MIQQYLSLTDKELKQLTNALLESIIDGASLGFLASVSYQQIYEYWLSVLSNLNKDFLLLLAKNNDNIVGAVQISLCHKDNGKHRGEIQKLFVVPSYRGNGLATQLMETAEILAKDNALSLLVLDTESGSNAEGFYQCVGYQKVGEIPHFALSPASEMAATSIYYKQL